jgi:hypothetical protein
MLKDRELLQTFRYYIISEQSSLKHVVGLSLPSRDVPRYCILPSDEHELLAFSTPMSRRCACQDYRLHVLRPMRLQDSGFALAVALGNSLCFIYVNHSWHESFDLRSLLLAFLVRGTCTCTHR